MENPLQETPETDNGASSCKVSVRTPKRIIHCSDGTVEEYSDDECDAEPQQAAVDPKKLDWVPWFVHYAYEGGARVVAGVDYVGEGLADLLGITTPKYQLEISEYERMEAARKKLDEESWVKANGTDVSLVTMQPSSDAPAEPKPEPI